MPLRARVESNPETLQDLDIAGEQHYWEAIEMMVCQHNATGIYLMGYVAEILLKAAYFRLSGAALADPLDAYLRPARNLMRTRYRVIDAEGGHGLFYWLTLLRMRRQILTRPLSVDTEMRLVRAIRRLRQEWWVGMRYRPDQASPEEAQLVYNEVSWLRANYLTFWR